MNIEKKQPKNKKKLIQSFKPKNKKTCKPKKTDGHDGQDELLSSCPVLFIVVRSFYFFFYRLD